ncbi:uncharacterized protein [Eurosta solidaginis]|uniref:uncharacterized protein n=1 Tax=Eurosta solidaginis TaxID=178769 RepID=UPI00353116C7
MGRTRRQRTETPQEYYFKMVAIGKKVEIPESAIARYIINENTGDNTSDWIDKEENGIEGETSKNTAVSEISKVVKCYKCSQQGHISVNCPQPQRMERCGVCNRTGHKMIECKQTATKPILNTKINKINRNEIQNENLTKEIKVNEYETKAIIDSGSVCSLIHRKLATQIGEITECTRVLKGFAGGTYQCKAKILASIQIDNNRHPAKLLVVDDNHIDEDVLLGRDVFCQSGKRLIIENDKCTVEKLENVSNISEEERSKLQAIIQSNGDIFAENIAELGLSRKNSTGRG